MIVQMFRAQVRTRRFRKNQKVWVRLREQNHLIIWFRWRGRGTYVRGVIERTHDAVGALQDIDVNCDFARQIHGWDL